MDETKNFSLPFADRVLTVELGMLAQLASGSARVQYGDTVVLATTTMSSNVRPNIDYFPLMVDYEENLYAAGKIKGSRFIKREGRPSDLAVLNARITDRSLRPLFNDRIRNDVQVILNVLSVDQENDPSCIALNAASLALAISEIPWDGPIAGISVASIDSQYVINPTVEQRTKATLFMLLAIRNEEVVMMEAEGNDADETLVLGAIQKGIEHAQPLLKFMRDIIRTCGKQKITPSTKLSTPEQTVMEDGVKSKVDVFLAEHLPSLFGVAAKQERMQREEKIREQMRALFTTDEECAIADQCFVEAYEKEFRESILTKGARVDGRALDEIRSLSAHIDLLPRTHGSALFQRGETQVLSTVTLGAPGDAQTIDGLGPEYQKRFMHHYDFPPFSVGEVRPLRGPSRRDIGHGALAEKALESIIPSKEKFPYTIRVVSDVLMSNGSSSQASVCGSSLALLAAGVPVRHPIAGIAMGLVMNADKTEYKILTDIQGIEDHSGDMDFKVAGTREGICAIQLDIKLGGITLDICRDALAGAKRARLQILDVMDAVIATPRTELSPYAPRIEILTINPELIGDLIGPGGKVINKIIEETGVEIDIEDDGSVFVTATSGEAMARAKDMIIAITREVGIGEEFTGRVTQIVKDRNSGKEIGAVVDLGGGKTGMIHISNICHKRIPTVTSVISIGSEVRVRVLEVDKERGRVSLSRKDCVPSGSADSLCDAVAAVSDTEGDDRGGWKNHQGQRFHRGHGSHGQRTN